MNRVWIATLAAAMFAMSGCESTTRIVARDQGVFVPSIKASVNFGRGAEMPSLPQDGHAIEFEVIRTKGRDNQSLAANESPIKLGGQSFLAPQELRHDFAFTYADIGWRWRHFFGGGALGLEALAGLGYAGLELGTTSATLQASQGFYTRGAQGGVGLIWRVQASTSVHLRLTEFASLGEGVSHADRAEVFLNHALARNVTARIGYTGWEVNADALPNSSAFRLRFSGPALGLQFDFGP